MVVIDDLLESAGKADLFSVNNCLPEDYVKELMDKSGYLQIMRFYPESVHVMSLAKAFPSKQDPEIEIDGKFSERIYDGSPRPDAELLVVGNGFFMNGTNLKKVVDSLSSLGYDSDRVWVSGDGRAFQKYS